MTNYKVVEIFSSINGEGTRAGQLAVFVRMQGCNLNCTYCDTKWAHEADAKFHWTSTEEILELLRSMEIKNVTITGGEPLLQEEIGELLEAMAKEENLRVEIETNGSVPLQPFAEIPNGPSFTMDYKLSCSGMESFMDTDNFSLLTQKDTVKFVTGSLADCERALEVMKQFQLIGRCHLYFSPVFGSIDPADIVEFMKENHLNGVNLQIQMHKVIWDPDRRGV